MDARKRRFGKRRFLGNKYGGFRVGGQAGGPINQLEVAHVREAPTASSHTRYSGLWVCRRHHYILDVAARGGAGGSTERRFGGSRVAISDAF